MDTRLSSPASPSEEPRRRRRPGWRERDRQAARRSTPSARPRLPIDVLLMLGIAVIGLALGAGIGLLTRTSRPSSPPIFAEKPTVHAYAPAHIALSPLRHVAPRVAPAPVAHGAPAVPPRTAEPAPRVAVGGGTWRIDEANRVVGEMVWSAQAIPVGTDAVQITARKAIVAGRSATPCERETVLRTVVSVAHVPQSVPYHETNCSGATSTGEVHVVAVSPADHTLRGSFWRDGAKLGDFTASTP